MNALREKLLEVFQIEHREHSEAIRSILSGSGGAGEGLSKAELTEAIRRAHSLKGAARAVGLAAVETLAHDLESLFAKIESGEAGLDPETEKYVVRALDDIEDLVVAPPDEEQEPDAGEAQPDQPDGEQPAAVQAEADANPRPQERSQTPAKAGAAASDFVRVKAEDLDRLLKSAGELHADMLFQQVGVQEVQTICRKMDMLESLWAQSYKSLERRLHAATGQDATRTLYSGDEISSRIKSLSKELRTVAQRQARGTRTFRHHLNDLENRIISARMVPAESVFGGFRKMVRDVAAEEGKQVDISIEGLDCEADRLVLQRIKDPVMHMLRNAVSHGIEGPEERIRKGKEPHGRVRFTVKNEHDRLKVVIEDDGRGIDFRRIARKAVEQNRLSEEEAETAGEQMLSAFLFEPGFSTADEITRISGRGVGLSVVHEAIGELQGVIDLAPRAGGGTRMEVSLPVSILARRLLLVSLKDQIFAFPSESIARVMRAAISDISTLEGRPILRLKNAALPLTSIGELLSLGDTIVAAGSDSLSVVVLQKGGAQLGVAVDSFVGVNDFVVRHFKSGSGKRRRWMGLITTEDGTPSLVLNADALLGGELAQHRTRLDFQSGKGDVDRSKTILVVDDSITTRTLEKSILEAHGYRVRLSVDGRDALAQLRSELPDIVISDVDMPHMDGFDLLQAIKADRSLSHLPVVLVTSRSEPKDRERGLELGADAYVVKQRFDQNELLQTIRQII